MRTSNSQGSDRDFQNAEMCRTDYDEVQNGDGTWMKVLFGGYEIKCCCRDMHKGWEGAGHRNSPVYIN